MKMADIPPAIREDEVSRLQELLERALQDARFIGDPAKLDRTRELAELLWMRGVLPPATTWTPDRFYSR